MTLSRRATGALELRRTRSFPRAGLSLALLLGGCHWIYGYQQSSGASDGPPAIGDAIVERAGEGSGPRDLGRERANDGAEVDGSVLDVPSLDRQGRGEGPIPEGPPADLPHLDGVGPDAAKPDGALPDMAAPDGPRREGIPAGEVNPCLAWAAWGCQLKLQGCGGACGGNSISCNDQSGKCSCSSNASCTMPSSKLGCLSCQELFDKGCCK